VPCSGMLSSMNASATSPSGLSIPSQPPPPSNLPSLDGNQMMALTSGGDPFLICQDPFIISGNASSDLAIPLDAMSSFYDPFILMCSLETKIDLRPQQCDGTMGLHSRGPKTAERGISLPQDPPKCGKFKTYECDRCEQTFSRSCDLRKHQIMHAGEERFACDFLGCRKKFGVLANLKRHKAAHGLRRKGPASPRNRGQFRKQVFESKYAPPVHSDITSMRADVIWDHEGPFACRPAHSPAPPMVETKPRTSSTLRVPRQRALRSINVSH